MIFVNLNRFDLTTSANWDHREWLEIAIKGEGGKIRNQPRNENIVPKSARKAQSNQDSDFRASPGGTPPPAQCQSQGGKSSELVIDANWLGNVHFFSLLPIIYHFLFFLRRSPPRIVPKSFQKCLRSRIFEKSGR